MIILSHVKIGCRMKLIVSVLALAPLFPLLLVMSGIIPTRERFGAVAGVPVTIWASLMIMAFLVLLCAIAVRTTGDNHCEGRQ